MENNIASRLKIFITHLGINDSSFADTCGISRSTLSLLLSGRNKKVNDQQIVLIHKAYPELSIVWLIFGEGQMLISDSTESKNEENPHPQESEISEFPPMTGNPIENSNLNALNSQNLSIKQLIDIQLQQQQKIQQLESKIQKIQQEPRKVTKITIFYDDSTFETFTPDSL